MDNRAIGVFDSGIGGLTALSEMRRLLPCEHYFFLGDTARVPYGSHTDDVIIQYAEDDLRFLLAKNVKAVLVACGTVSATSLKHLREMTQIPILGVIDTAAQIVAQKGGKALVMGTGATIRSHAFRNQVQLLSPACEVYEKACPMLSVMIENGYYDGLGPVPQLVLRDYIGEFSSVKLNSVLLGCTHYAVYRDSIQTIFPNAMVVDAGKEAAKSLVEYLKNSDMLTDRTSHGSLSMYVTELTDSFRIISGQLFGQSVLDNISKCVVD